MSGLPQLLPAPRWRIETLAIQGLPVLAATAITAPQAAWHVYIEGDGAAYLSRSRPSANPTPRGFSAAQLAQTDTAPNIVYLGRPCQWFKPGERPPACKPNVWTSRRFSPDMAERMNRAYRQLVPPGAGVTLIAYSGGGAHALYIARRNPNVQRLLTVAGNLAPDATNRHHAVTRHADDISPLAPPGPLSALPQRHLVGEDDAVIPAMLTGGLLASAHLSCAALEVHVATHQKGWLEQWPGLLNQPFPCHTEPPVQGMSGRSAAW